MIPVSGGSHQIDDATYMLAQFGMPIFWREPLEMSVLAISKLRYRLLQFRDTASWYPSTVNLKSSG